MDTYPSTIPCPQSIVHVPNERRALATASRPRDARALQIDEQATEQVTWPPLTSAQYMALYEFWATTLVYGGKWFTSTWPSPRGQIETARRFASAPNWNFIGGPNGGYWRPTATIETRGRYYEAVAEVDSYMLLEDGDFVLLEGGDFVILE